MFWRHYFIVKLNCFKFRTATVAGLGVPTFRVFTVEEIASLQDQRCVYFELERFRFIGYYIGKERGMKDVQKLFKNQAPRL